MEKKRFMVDLIATASMSQVPPQIIHQEYRGANDLTELHKDVESAICYALQRAYEGVGYEEGSNWLEPRILRVNIEIVRRWEEEPNG